MQDQRDRLSVVFQRIHVRRPQYRKRFGQMEQNLFPGFVGTGIGEDDPQQRETGVEAVVKQLQE